MSNNNNNRNNKNTLLDREQDDMKLNLMPGPSGIQRFEFKNSEMGPS